MNKEYSVNHSRPNNINNMWNIFKLTKNIASLKQENLRLTEELRERDREISDLKWYRTHWELVRTSLHFLPQDKACICYIEEEYKEWVSVGFVEHPGIYIKDFPYERDDPQSKEFAIAQAQYLCDLLNEEL